MAEIETIEIDDETAADGAAQAASVSANGGGGAGEDGDAPDTEALLAELESKREECSALQDRLLRAHAEFENIRKRLQREKDEVVRYAAFETIRSLLPVVDDFEKAIGSEHLSGEVKQGLEQIHQKMFGVFERAGLRQVDQHETFDPNLHEALARAPAEDEQADQQILEVWRKGYLFKDRLMRASWVKVAVKE